MIPDSSTSASSYRDALNAAPTALRLYAAFLVLLALVELILYLREPLRVPSRFLFEVGYLFSIPVALSAILTRLKRTWKGLLSLLGIQVLSTTAHILYLVSPEEVAPLVLWSIVPSILWGLVLCLPQIRNFLDRDAI